MDERGQYPQQIIRRRGVSHLMLAAEGQLCRETREDVTSAVTFTTSTVQSLSLSVSHSQTHTHTGCVPRVFDQSLALELWSDCRLRAAEATLVFSLLISAVAEMKMKGVFTQIEQFFFSSH